MASTVSDALEQEVAAIKAIAPVTEGHRGPTNLRDRLAIDRHFSEILHLLAPRIRHFIGRYGLVDMREDAEQACAIAVHRAISDFDEAKARFTTFVNWQLRGELQSLRFRVRLDQRESARKVGASTISLATPVGAEDSTLADTLIDDAAERRVAAGARDALAAKAANDMLDDYVELSRRMAMEQLERTTPRSSRSRKGTTKMQAARIAALEAKIKAERAITKRHLLGGQETAEEGNLSKEQKRQVARRVLRHMSRRAETSERFNPEMRV